MLSLGGIISGMIIGLVVYMWRVIGPAILLLIGNYYINPNLDFMIATFTIPKYSDWIYITLLGSFATLAQIYMTRTSVS